MSESVVRVWEWPLRLWHWVFALALTGSLTTGLSGEIGWMDWHLRFGYVVLGALLFRVVWGFVGGPYSRWSTYRTTPGRVLAWFSGMANGGGAPADAAAAHTPPGVFLIWVMLLAVLVQALTGLATTDDIFVEGPLVRHADEALVEAATAIHHRVFYLVLAAISAHLTAHLVYAFRRDPLPLAMFTGRRSMPPGMPAAPALGWRALLLGAVSGLLVWWGLRML